MLFRSEILGDVEGLAGAEEHVGKDGIEQSAAVASGAVEEKDGVVDVTVGSAVWLAQGEVMQVELRKSFATAEPEVLEDIEVIGCVPFGGWRILADNSESTREYEAENSGEAHEIPLVLEINFRGTG